MISLGKFLSDLLAHFVQMMTDTYDPHTFSNEGHQHQQVHEGPYLASHNIPLSDSDQDPSMGIDRGTKASINLPDMAVPGIYVRSATPTPDLLSLDDPSRESTPSMGTTTTTTTTTSALASPPKPRRSSQVFPKRLLDPHLMTECPTAFSQIFNDMELLKLEFVNLYQEYCALLDSRTHAETVLAEYRARHGSSPAIQVNVQALESENETIRARVMALETQLAALEADKQTWHARWREEEAQLLTEEHRVLLADRCGDLEMEFEEARLQLRAGYELLLKERKQFEALKRVFDEEKAAFVCDMETIKHDWLDWLDQQKQDLALKEASLAAKNELLHQDTTALETALASLAHQLGLAKTDKVGLQQALSGLQTSLATLAAERDVLMADKEALQAASQTQLTSLEKDLQVAQSTRLDIQRQLDETLGQQESLKAHIADLQHELDSLRRERASQDDAALIQVQQQLDHVVQQHARELAEQQQKATDNIQLLLADRDAEIQTLLLQQTTRFHDDEQRYRQQIEILSTELRESEAELVVLRHRSTNLEREYALLVDKVALPSDVPSGRPLELETENAELKSSLQTLSDKCTSLRLSYDQELLAKTKLIQQIEVMLDKNRDLAFRLADQSWLLQQLLDTHGLIQADHGRLLQLVDDLKTQMLELLQPFLASSAEAGRLPESEWWERCKVLELAIKQLELEKKAFEAEKLAFYGGLAMKDLTDPKGPNIFGSPIRAVVSDVPTTPKSILKKSSAAVQSQKKQASSLRFELSSVHPDEPTAESSMKGLKPSPLAFEGTPKASPLVNQHPMSNQSTMFFDATENPLELLDDESLSVPIDTSGASLAADISITQPAYYEVPGLQDGNDVKGAALFSSELRTANLKLVEAKATIESLSRDLGDLKGELELLRNENDTLSTLRDDLCSSIVALKAQVDQLTRTQETLGLDNERLLQDLNVLSLSKESVLKELVALKQDLVLERSLSCEKDARLSALEDANASKTRDLESKIQELQLQNLMQKDQESPTAALDPSDKDKDLLLLQQSEVVRHKDDIIGDLNSLVEQLRLQNSDLKSRLHFTKKELAALCQSRVSMEPYNTTSNSLDADVTLLQISQAEDYFQDDFTVTDSSTLVEPFSHSKLNRILKFVENSTMLYLDDEPSASQDMSLFKAIDSLGMSRTPSDHNIMDLLIKELEKSRGYSSWVDSLLEELNRPSQRPGLQSQNIASPDSLASKDPLRKIIEPQASSIKDLENNLHTRENMGSIATSNAQLASYKTQLTKAVLKSRYWKVRCRRELCYRSDLIYQKKYLLLLFNALGISPYPEQQRPLVSTFKKSFYNAALAVIAIERLKLLAKKSRLLSYQASRVNIA